MEAVRNSQSAIKRHVSAYILSMAIIAALIISFFYFDKMVIERHEDDAAIINMIGRQRMLSQRAVKEALLLFGASSEREKGKYRGELLNTKNELADGYGVLTGEAEEELAGENALERIGGLYARFNEQIESALRAGVESGQRQAVPGNLIDASTAYVDAVDRINVLLVKDRKDEQIGYLRYNLVFTAAILATLSLTLLFIFLPLIRKYKEVLGNYEESNGKLLAEIETRKQVEETLKLHRSHLENMVADRTAAFVELNKELGGKVDDLNDAVDLLMESEKRYRTLIDLSPEAITVEKEGKFIFANKAALDLFGVRSTEDLYGMAVDEFVHGDYRDVLARYREHLANGLEKTHLACQCKRVDGRLIYVEVASIPITLHDRPCVLSITRDVSYKKILEGRVRENEVRYRTVMENMPDAVLIIDLEAEGGVMPIVDINESALAMHGYRREELIGKDISILQSAQDKIAAAELLPRVLAGEDVGVIAIKHIKRDGSALPLEIRVKPVILDGRKHLLAIERDISARLARISALQESENRFQRLIENINDWVWEVDGNGVYTYASPRVHSLLGYMPEEVIGKTPFDLMPEREANLMRVEFGTIVALQKPFTGLENINLHKDGHEVVLETSGMPIFGKDGELVGFRGVDRDITEKKAAMDGLKNLKNAIDNVNEMIIITDRRGTIKYANAEFLKKETSKAAEIIGRNINLIAPFGGLLLQGIWSVADGKQPWSISTKSSGPDHGHREYEILISPVFDNEGWVENCVIVIRDVTLEKDLGNKLAHSEKLSMIGTFVSGVAHELNNPLMSILGYSRSIMEDCGGMVAADAKKDIGIIVEEARRAVSIVKDLLQYSKKATISPKSVDINRVVDAALQSVRDVFADGKVKFQGNRGNEAVYVYADDVKLQQVLVNILSNANNQIRKTEEGGIVTVTAKLNDGQAVIDIENDGPSIPEYLIGKIFDPFFTTSATGEGTGLGLFISSKIVTEHDGLLTVENLQPKGVRFRIALRAVIKAATDESALAEPARTLTKPVKMLVVDDNRQIRDWFKDHFGKNRNIAITLAANGADALAAIKKQEYDVILSDVKMPVMGGLALKNWLMENRPDCLERLVLMSGLADEKVESDARQAGCHFLQKPFEQEELLEVVSRIGGGGGVSIL